VQRQQALTLPVMIVGLIKLLMAQYGLRQVSLVKSWMLTVAILTHYRWQRLMATHRVASQARSKRTHAIEVMLYTVTHSPDQINEVPQSDINFITTSDGNGVNAVKESGLVVTQCIEFHKSEDNFGAGEVPKEAAFPQPDGTWRRVEIATEHTDGVNGALAANRALNQ